MRLRECQASRARQSGSRADLEDLAAADAVAVVLVMTECPSFVTEIRKTKKTPRAFLRGPGGRSRTARSLRRHCLMVICASKALIRSAIAVDRGQNRKASSVPVQTATAKLAIYKRCFPIAAINCNSAGARLARYEDSTRMQMPHVCAVHPIKLLKPRTTPPRSSGLENARHRPQSCRGRTAHHP